MGTVCALLDNTLVCWYTNHVALAVKQPGSKSLSQGKMRWGKGT